MAQAETRYLLAVYQLCEDGGAVPYVHSPTCLYAMEDLSFPFTSLADVEIIGASESDELEE